MDINNGTIILPPSSIDDIIQKIPNFLTTQSHKPLLHKWQHLSGHLNWMLNVLPWGCPTLSKMYYKVGGKAWAYCGIFVNTEVQNDLTWPQCVILQAISVHFIDAGLWSDSQANFEVWTDANSKFGLSFVYHTTGFFYKSCEPTSTAPKVDIFFLELVTILSIHHVASLQHPPK